MADPEASREAVEYSAGLEEAKAIMGAAAAEAAAGGHHMTMTGSEEEDHEHEEEDTMSEDEAEEGGSRKHAGSASVADLGPGSAAAAARRAAAVALLPQRPLSTRKHTQSRNWRALEAADDATTSEDDDGAWEAEEAAEEQRIATIATSVGGAVVLCGTGSTSASPIAQSPALAALPAHLQSASSSAAAAAAANAHWLQQQQQQFGGSVDAADAAPTPPAKRARCAVSAANASPLQGLQPSLSQLQPQQPMLTASLHAACGYPAPYAAAGTPATAFTTTNAMCVGSGFAGEALACRPAQLTQQPSLQQQQLQLPVGLEAYGSSTSNTFTGVRVSIPANMQQQPQQQQPYQQVAVYPPQQCQVSQSLQQMEAAMLMQQQQLLQQQQQQQQQLQQQQEQQQQQLVQQQQQAAAMADCGTELEGPNDDLEWQFIMDTLDAAPAEQATFDDWTAGQQQQAQAQQTQPQQAQPMQVQQVLPVPVVAAQAAPAVAGVNCYSSCSSGSAAATWVSGPQQLKSTIVVSEVSTARGVRGLVRAQKCTKDMRTVISLMVNCCCQYSTGAGQLAAWRLGDVCPEAAANVDGPDPSHQLQREWERQRQWLRRWRRAAGYRHVGGRPRQRRQRPGGCGPGRVGPFTGAGGAGAHLKRLPLVRHSPGPGRVLLPRDCRTVRQSVGSAAAATADAAAASHVCAAADRGAELRHGLHAVRALGCQLYGLQPHGRPLQRPAGLPRLMLKKLLTRGAVVIAVVR